MKNLILDFFLTAIIYLAPATMYCIFKKNPISLKKAKIMSWVFAVIPFIAILIIDIVIIALKPQISVSTPNVVAMVIWRWIISKMIIVCVSDNGETETKSNESVEDNQEKNESEVNEIGSDGTDTSDNKSQI